MSDTTNDKTFGYNTSNVYNDRWDLINKNIIKDEFSLLDWGSDEGWFSVKASQTYASSSIISVDAGMMMNKDSVLSHYNKIIDRGLKNNFLVNSYFGASTFKELKRFRCDYQLVLSVFHWLGDGYGSKIKTISDWDNLFCDMIQVANITFFEIPNVLDPNETPHRIRHWYNGRDELTILTQALKNRDISAEIKCIGSIQHGEKGERKLFKIELANKLQKSPVNHIINCINIEGQKIKLSSMQRIHFFLSLIKYKILKCIGKV